MGYPSLNLNSHPLSSILGCQSPSLQGLDLSYNSLGPKGCPLAKSKTCGVFTEYFEAFSKHFRSISEPWFCFPMARHWRQGIMRLTMPESILGDIHVIGGRCGRFLNVTFWKALIWWSGWIRTTRTAASFHDISCASIIGATEACDLGKRNRMTMLYRLY